MASSDSNRSPWRRLLLALVVILAAGSVWYFTSREPEAGPDPSRAPWEGDQGPRRIPVRTVLAQRQDLPVHLKAIGTVTPLNTVTVRSRVDGQLLRVAFEEGQLVEKGQLLAEIDPAPYEIQLAQAEAQQRQAEAQLEAAKRDLERLRQLHTTSLITAQEFQLQQTLVAEREGALASIQADVDDAKLQLAYTKIESPISGRLGFRQVDAGNLIRAGDQNGLVVITQTRPIAVVFTVPENDLEIVLEPLRAGREVPVEAWNRTGQKRLTTGTLKTVDNQIDVATGTLRLKAEFPNGDERLFPNQFVNVRLPVRTLTDAVVIPAAAVQYGSRGTYVFVVNDRNEAIVRDVVLGPADGTLLSVTDGLRPGEPVVLEGLDRLRDGSAVVMADEEPAAPVSPSTKADT